MIVSHHGGGLIGHVTAAPCLSYKWHDVLAAVRLQLYPHNKMWLAFVSNRFMNAVFISNMEALCNPLTRFLHNPMR